MDYSTPEQHAKLLAESYASEATQAHERMSPEGGVAGAIWQAGYMGAQSLIFIGDCMREIAKDYVRPGLDGIARAIDEMAMVQREALDESEPRVEGDTSTAE